MAAHVFVEDLARPVPAEADLHHLSRVLRLRPGEPVTACDGRGSTRACEWVGAGTGGMEGRHGSLRALGDVTWEAPAEPPLTVGFALTKGDRPEWAVQKLTEAGVDRVVVMTTQRCNVRWAPGSEQDRIRRLREVARQAAMQSRRTWLPVVDGPVPFTEVVSQARSAELAEPLAGLRGPGAAERAMATGPVAMAVPGAGPVDLAYPVVLVGPEGGWTDEELAAAPHVGLGPNVLRAETAALAAGLIMGALRCGLVAPASTQLGRPKG